MASIFSTGPVFTLDSAQGLAQPWQRDCPFINYKFGFIQISQTWIYTRRVTLMAKVSTVK